MWNRVKKLSVINTKMSSIKPDEIAIEAINAPLSPETTTITDPILQEKLDQVVPDDDDSSSIEALAWTDFTDDELETAKELAAKEFPSNNQQKEQVEEEEEHQEVEKENVDPNSESQLSEEGSSSNSKESEEDSPCSVMSISNTSQTLVLTGNDDDGDIAIVNYKSNIMETEELMSDQVPISSGYSLFEDKVSNAPVLDDGPIWGTGTKLYKFHENRERNQKLTFWVLISIVLAIGIGVGNLVAYNEYENEHKPIDQQHCPAPSRIPTVSPYNPSVSESSVNMKVLDKNFGQDIGKDNHFNTILKSPEIGESSSSYVSSIHTETLAHVVKSIDELSKKIDMFNNTTKQLSGIIVMKEDVKRKVHSSEDEFSQFLPTFNDDLSKQNQWENKMNEPVCSKSQKRTPNIIDDKLMKPNHGIPEKKQEKDTTTTTSNNNDDSKLKPKNNEAREEINNNQVSGKKKQKRREKNPDINADDKNKKTKTKVEKSRAKQEKYDKKKQHADETIKDDKQEKKHFQKTEKKSIVRDNGEENEKHFQNQQQQGKQKKFKRQTAVDNEYEYDKYNKKSKKSKTRKAEYDTQNYNSDDKSFENDNYHQQKQKNVHNKPDKDYYEKEYKSDKKSKKNKDDTKFVINENQGNSFFVASETIPEKRRKNHSEKEIEKKKNNEKPQYVDNNGKNGKKYKKDKPVESSDEENYNQKSNEHQQVKVSDYKMNNNNKDQDWISERAKARENIRVYQNWESDFNSDNNNDYKIKRKRSSSWQIERGLERDRLREKIRKHEDD